MFQPTHSERKALALLWTTQGLGELSQQGLQSRKVLGQWIRPIFQQGDLGKGA